METVVSSSCAFLEPRRRFIFRNGGPTDAGPTDEGSGDRGGVGTRTLRADFRSAELPTSEAEGCRGD